MTHVDDLYEPGDDREPEPDDRDDDGPYELDDLPRMLDTLIAELREARQRIAEFEALPIREDWTVTPRRDIAPAQLDPLKPMFDSGDLTAESAARNGWQLWRQRSSVHPWEPISSKSPF